MNRRTHGQGRIWAPILAEPPVTEPHLAVPPVACDATGGASGRRDVAVRAGARRAQPLATLGGGERPSPLVYSTSRVVGPMACSTTDWSAAVVASREVLLDDVERITVEPGVLNQIDRRTSDGDLVTLGTSSGDGVVLVLSSGERCAPLALAHGGRDIDESAAFLAVLDELAIPVDPAVRRLLAP